MTRQEVSEQLQREPLTQQQLDEIRARCEAATPGPWQIDRNADLSKVNDCAMVRGIQVIGPYRAISAISDAAFIAASRSDVAALLAEVERLQQQVTELESRNELLSDQLQSLEAHHASDHANWQVERQNLEGAYRDLEQQTRKGLEG